MAEIDPITGLPKELGVWDAITKESQEISVYTIKKKFGKEHTVVEGMDKKDVDMKEMVKKLKAKFACGGTVKGGKIELQGNHKFKVKQILIDMGFPEASINMK